MRRPISDTRRELRRREEEFKLLGRDRWVRTNSEIDAQKLHALGVVTFRWNVCENKLISLFWTLLNVPPEEAQIIWHDLSMIEVMRRVKALAAIKLKEHKELVAAVEHALEVFNSCRINRNQLSHFTFVLARDAETGPYRLALARMSRKPEYRERIPFPDSINDIRRVARDIRRLNAFLTAVERRAAATIKPSRLIKLEDWPLPKALALPELLWPPKGTGE